MNVPKRALLLFGQFRSFERVLADLLSYIDYSVQTFDVFVLTDRAGGYSTSKEELFRRMLGGESAKIVRFEFWEDVGQEAREVEEVAARRYSDILDRLMVDNRALDLLSSFAEEGAVFQQDAFVARMWSRRAHLGRLMEAHERDRGVPYDIIVRGRPDIGFLYRPSRYDFSLSPALVFADVLTIGPRWLLDAEMEFSKVFPCLPEMTLNLEEMTLRPPTEDTLLGVPKDRVGGMYHPRWIMMSEMNLIAYFYTHCTEPFTMAHQLFRITR